MKRRVIVLVIAVAWAALLVSCLGSEPALTPPAAARSQVTALPVWGDASAPIPTRLEPTPASAPSDTPSASIQAEAKPQSTDTPALSPTEAAPVDELDSSVPTPAGPSIRMPYRAWVVSPDDGLYLLDSAGSIIAFSPDLSHAFTASAPIFGGADPALSHLAVNDNFLILSSETLSRTVALGREAFELIGSVGRGGPVALAPDDRLFLLADDAVWAYDVANLGALPRPVTEWPVNEFTPRPRNLAVDSVNGQLLVRLENIAASPPHRQQSYLAYDIDSLEFLRYYPSHPGALTRPSAGGGVIVAGLDALNGFLGSKVLAFGPTGEQLVATQPFDGKPVVDPKGEWIYVLRDRGTFVLRAADLALVAVDSYRGNAPADLLLSPDGELLYEVSENAIGLRRTADIRQAGIAPHVGPLLPNWFDPSLPYQFRARFFPVTDKIAFAQVGGYGETWRTADGAQTWHLLPGLVHPNFHYVTHLSISPDFVTDQTLIAVAQGEPGYLRSTDGGDAWQAWAPPVAFVSDRDGNREIYTADRGKLGDGPAQNLVRRTADLADDENPAWSPGWTRIAFQSNRNGNWDIYTIRADCDPMGQAAVERCDLRQLTNDPGDDMLPAWSPDGKWIAFVSTRDGSPQIHVVPATGGTARRLTGGPRGSWRPAWQPDSQRLLYTTTAAGGSNDIFAGRVAVGADGLPALAEVTPIVAGPPDERDPALARDYLVYLTNEDGLPRVYGRYNYEHATSFAFTAGTESEGHPAVVEDGLNTLLVTLDRGGRRGIYRANTSGYEPYAVDAAFNGQPAAGPVPWQPAADWSEKAAREWQKNWDKQ